MPDQLACNTLLHVLPKKIHRKLANYLNFTTVNKVSDSARQHLSAQPRSALNMIQFSNKTALFQNIFILISSFLRKLLSTSGPEYNRPYTKD